MKNGIKLLLLLIFVLFWVLTFSALSHPGRTDVNGGHWDRKEGTYHFHTGEYVGKGGGGSSYSEYVPFTPPYEPPTDNPYRSNNTISSVGGADSISFKSILIVLLLLWVSASSIYEFFNATYYRNKGVYAVIGIGFGIMLIFYCLEEHLFTVKSLTVIGIIGFVLASHLYSYHVFLYLIFEKHLPRYKINLLNEKMNIFQQEQDEIFEINTKIFNLKAKYKIPNLYEIGTDNLPKDKNSVLYWGKSFTLYKTDKGMKLHAKHNCCSATKPLHIYRCRNYRDFPKLLCKKCADDYVVPDMSWYEDYLKYGRAVSKRQSIENSCDKLQKEIKTLHKKCNSIKIKILIMFSKKNKKALKEANDKYKKIQTGTQLSLFDYMESEDKSCKMQ